MAFDIDEPRGYSANYSDMGESNIQEVLHEKNRQKFTYVDGGADATRCTTMQGTGCDW
jgi:hypothetical protein